VKKICKDQTKRNTEMRQTHHLARDSRIQGNYKDLEEPEIKCKNKQDRTNVAGGKRKRTEVNEEGVLSKGAGTWNGVS
jgi:hypothetical protein